jgi:hypothetical protein
VKTPSNASALLFLAALIVSCASDPIAPPPPGPALVEFDPPGPKAPDVAARAAVFLGSCMSNGHDGLSPQNLLDRMYYVFQVDEPFSNAIEATTRCFTDRANGCKAVEECFATHVVPHDGACDKACSSDNVATLCGETWSIVTDCNRLGMQCTSAGCSPHVPHPSCDPATFELCKDGVANNCPSAYGLFFQGAPCTELGLVCTTMPVADEPWAICKGTGAACEPFGLDTTDCNPRSTLLTTCEGDQIVICNAGRVDRIDCKALGFDGCDPDVGLCYPSPASTR